MTSTVSRIEVQHGFVQVTAPDGKRKFYLSHEDIVEAVYLLIDERVRVCLAHVDPKEGDATEKAIEDAYEQLWNDEWDSFEAQVVAHGEE